MKVFVLISILTLSNHFAGANDIKAINPPIHYFYNSGWMIETDKHVVVIDFITHAASGTTLRQLENLLRQADSRGKKIIVLVTHEHQDHFDPLIFQLSNNFSGIKYILGWKYKADASIPIQTLIAGDSVIQADYKIYTHASTDAGVGFLIEIDGYTIYHAGDHALWTMQMLESFTDQLKQIRSKAKHIDLAFLPAARGMFTKCTYDSTIRKGLQVSLEILNPHIVALQHIGCEDKLETYKMIHKQLMEKNGRKKWIVPDHFNQSIKNIL